jgi:aspartate kinase
MNNEVGYVAKLLGILAKYEISFDHVPTGIDTVSVVVDTDTLQPVKREVVHEIFTELEPDTLFVENGISLIAVVGLGMIRTKGVAARTLKAISDADINIRMLDQGSSELNIILGVNDDDYEKAIRSIYKELWS